MQNCDIETRSPKWDILKFFLVFLVVLGHAASFYTETSYFMKGLFLLIYSFHMPLFIFISGMFSKRNIDEKRYNKIFGYLIVYFALKLFEFFYKLLSGANPEFSVFSEGGAPWYMFALFSFSLLTIAVKKVLPKYVLIMSILLACVAGYDSDIGDFLVLSRTTVFFPFFYLGYCLDRKKIESLCRSRTNKIIAAAVLISFMAIVFVFAEGIDFFRPLLTGRNPFSKLGKYADFGFFIRLLYYAVVTLVSACVVILTPQKTHFGIAERLGQRTLAVYGLHYIVFYFMFVRFDVKHVLDEHLGMFSSLIPIILSVLLTLFFSLKIFNGILTKIMNVPLRKRTTDFNS